jgi:hypothetical protein
MKPLVGRFQSLDNTLPRSEYLNVLNPTDEPVIDVVKCGLNQRRNEKFQEATNMRCKEKRFEFIPRHGARHTIRACYCGIFVYEAAFLVRTTLGLVTAESKWAWTLV